MIGGETDAPVVGHPFEALEKINAVGAIRNGLEQEHQTSHCTAKQGRHPFAQAGHYESTLARDAG